MFFQMATLCQGFQSSGLDTLLRGVYSLEDLKILGHEKGFCPYFLARHAVNFAQVVVFSYQYIIDPKISELITKEFKKESIVVFDEAHNIGQC